jgi:hypothetical protein
VLASHFDVHDDAFEEVPGNCEVLGTLRTWPYYKLADVLGFHELDGRDSADVFEFGMADSSEICFDIFGDGLFLPDFDDGSVFLPEFEPVFFQIDGRVYFFDDFREAECHAIVS